MLRLRVLSAVVLIPVVLFVVGLGGIWMTLLVALAVGIGLDEAFQLFVEAGHRPLRWAGYLSAVIVVAAAHALPSSAGLGGAVAAAILITLVGQLMRTDRGGALTDWALTLSGTLYVAWCLVHFVLLRAIETPGFSPPFWQALGGPELGAGAWWLVNALLLVWLCDTAAYFVGMRWGRHKMSPYVSPKKSWEGTVAGLVCSLAVAAGLKPLLGLPISYRWSIGLGALVGVGGQVGDLAESLLKRQAGVKDSGRLIPGHGGMLDRLDSLMFVVPLTYYFLRWVLR